MVFGYAGNFEVKHFPTRSDARGFHTKWLDWISYVLTLTLNTHLSIWDNFWQLKALLNDEKCFLFHLKSSFHSQDAQIFVLTFWSSGKTAWLERWG